MMGSKNERVYQEFDPISRWEPQPGFENLIVYLPGFSKEQLKVQVTSARKLRVMGERPVGGTNWIRFRKEFPIPSDLDTDMITARFEGVNLQVKLPKLFKPPSNEVPKPQVEPVPKPQPQAQKTGNEQRQTATKPNPLAQKADSADQQAPPTKPASDKTAETVKSTEEAKAVEEKEREDRNGKRAIADTSDSGGVSKRSKKEGRLKDETSARKQEKEDQAKGLQNYKQLLGGMSMEIKNRRKLSIGLAMAAVLVLALGLYASKHVRCTIGESEI